MTNLGSFVGPCSPAGGGTYLPSGWTSTGALNGWRASHPASFPSSIPVLTPGTYPTTTANSCENGFVYVETDGGCGSDAAFASPRYDAGSVNSPTVSFAFHLQGVDAGTLSLEAWDGSQWATVWSISGDQGAGWQMGQAAVPTYADQCPVEARFRFSYSTASTGNLGDCALGNITFGEPTDPFGIFAPIEYQENGPFFAVAVDGVQARNDTCAGVDYAAAAVAIDFDDLGFLEITSDVGSRPYDLLLNSAPLKRGSEGALILTDGQLLNLDIGAPTTTSLGGSLSGGPLLATLPAGPNGSVLSIPVSNAGAPYTINAQGFALEASAALGIVLSQAISLSAVEGILIAGDDTMTPPSLDLSAPPFTLTNGFTFYGVNHTTIYVSGNGRILFDGEDSDTSPSISEHADNNPSISAFWTDLNQVRGGTIRAYSPAQDIVRIEWTDVPFFGSALRHTTNSFTIELDAQSGIIRLLGLQGLDTGQIGSNSTDDQLIGISPGNRVAGGQAMDPGAAAFAVGASGAGGPSDMLYFMHDISATASSLPIPVVAGLDQLVFTPDPMTGGYTWIGL